MIPDRFTDIQITTLWRPFHKLQNCLIRFSFQVSFKFIVCLGSLSCWKVKRGPINRLPDCMAWWMKICLYFSVFIIPSILNKSPTPPAEIQPQTCIDRPPCPTVGCKHGSCNSFPLLLRTNWRYMLPEISNFDCHSTAPSIGQNSSCCVLTHTSIVWSYFLFLKEAFLLQLYYERTRVFRIVDNALVSQSLNTYTCFFSLY